MQVERARELLGTELAALVGESYERAYGDMIRVQQLTEMEEILAVKRAGLPSVADASVAPRIKQLTHSMWDGRLRGVQRNVEVWQAILRWAGPALRWGGSWGRRPARGGAARTAQPGWQGPCQPAAPAACQASADACSSPRPPRWTACGA